MANQVQDLIAQKTTTSPILVLGAFDMQFGQFDKVVDALVKFENPHEKAWFDGWFFACSRSISGNTVTITINKLAIPGAGAWVNAETEHLDECKVTVTAGGE